MRRRSLSHSRRPWLRARRLPHGRNSKKELRGLASRDLPEAGAALRLQLGKRGRDYLDGENIVIEVPEAQSHIKRPALAE